ncbi:cytochrome-c oxidase, cbb3-type subunit III [Lutimaribacter sp. EGI FJ00015]|uniref:Cytochrome-c oxidase, cbb3-type subunit III n=1 Tax=Lutimaribacter degradans TaxID=2945989 RepID=A0ACC5ZWS5_9RHOB|nr:cytochrome-c oxidase, cbb3-type subunit III [Lutimaribacter sp. EGI FJ00013]MCM2562757.1 cytochrome-c oxidase, cbb3-type subunit III [Lutimaribacter sp. EGI FJ00013]MCO0613914.1 cytochrome-c oxidase, cbb3-type subunit III [Lutimaribacter sp. EGI FJ00015]MCO0636886.1 cytochrome-c oxidase, cbb3-type subunit III [Lutimaribacter sp. EGI FJ00014]
MAKQPNKKQEVETTGHEWDGIEEYNNPLPRWWLWVFYATIVWGIWYTIAYPAWPGIKSATAGYLGFSTRGQVAEDIAEFETRLEPINATLVAADLNEIRGNDELEGYAVNAGAAVYRTWCAQCHGSGAAGAVGYPNLQDDAWLWGGTMEEIHYTVSHGIRNEDDLDAHYSEMPAFGRDELLTREEVEQVVNYVMSLSAVNPPVDESLVEAGAEVYEINCVACHGEDAQGDKFQGAPNLADAIWLYGGDYDAIYETVWNSRFGVMPPMGGADLSEAEIRAVTTYVHQLGGGQDPE